MTPTCDMPPTPGILAATPPIVLPTWIAPFTNFVLAITLAPLSSAVETAAFLINPPAQYSGDNLSAADPVPFMATPTILKEPPPLIPLEAILVPNAFKPLPIACPPFAAGTIIAIPLVISEPTF